MKETWHRKYRPRRLEDYVFQDNSDLKTIITGWVNNKDFPDLLLMGRPGTGKTTLAKLLAETCGFDEADIMYVSASIANGIDTIRDKVIGFAERTSFGVKGRLVILDEVDYMTPNAQAALRNVISDDVSGVKFILCGNYPHKIIDALKSRCTPIVFDTMDKGAYAERLVLILSSEGVTFTPELLMEHLEANYPDLRKGIQSIETSSVNGVLHKPVATTTEVSDWMNYAIAHFQNGDIEEGRKYILDNITYEDYETFYEYLYKNIEVFAGENINKKDSCIICIAESIVNDGRVGNREINLAACLARLCKIYRA